MADWADSDFRPDDEIETKRQLIKFSSGDRCDRIGADITERLYLLRGACQSHITPDRESRPLGDGCLTNGGVNEEIKKRSRLAFGRCRARLLKSHNEPLVHAAERILNCCFTGLSFGCRGLGISSARVFN